MSDVLVIPCTFGYIASESASLTGSYTALRQPTVPEGCVLITYPTRPGTNEAVDLPSAHLKSPSVQVDELGHLALSE